MKEPTGDECTAHAEVIVHKGANCKRKGYACWYPQMGGYVSKCVIVPLGDGEANQCFDAFVWHDGEFPFSDDGDGNNNPVEIHHCMATQFIDFGKFAASVTGGEDDDE